MHLFIFREKHGDRYYVANNLLEVTQVALEVVSRRLKEGWYEQWPTPQFPELSRDQTEALPDGQIKNSARAIWDAYDSAMEAHTLNNKVIQEACEAVEQQDGIKALEVLRERDAFEYEGFDIERIEPVKEPSGEPLSEEDRKCAEEFLSKWLKRLNESRGKAYCEPQLFLEQPLVFLSIHNGKRTNVRTYHCVSKTESGKWQTKDVTPIIRGLGLDV